MARGVNKAIVLGNLGNDPEIRYTAAGTAVATVSVATSSQWKDKEGNKQEDTEWHRVVFFGRLAEIVGEYLKKGSSIYVEGRLRTQKWQDKMGQDRYTTEIIGNEMQMLGGGTGNQGGFGQGGGFTPNQNTGTPQNNQQHNNQGGGFDDFDDEIPF